MASSRTVPKAVLRWIRAKENDNIQRRRLPEVPDILLVGHTQDQHP